MVERDELCEASEITHIAVLADSTVGSLSVRRAGVVDTVAIALFVLIGRASHHHNGTLSGFVSTAWPFAVGAAVGWLVVRPSQAASPRRGAAIACITTVVGMVLRVLAGQGTALTFIVVALCFLAATMVGGRVLLRTSVGVRRQRA